jgi:hypothetical protein
MKIAPKQIIEPTMATGSAVAAEIQMVSAPQVNSEPVPWNVL